jgi:hypothetical protein
MESSGIRKRKYIMISDGVWEMESSGIRKRKYISEKTLFIGQNTVYVSEK